MAAKPKKASAKKAAPKKTRKKRARKEDGSFKADDPTTPDVNEAFVVDDEAAADQARREAQRKKFAPPSADTGAGTRYLGGKLI
jgi:hypothetical protein